MRSPSFTEPTEPLNVRSPSKIVVFTATTDPTELHGVFKAGADGIVLKEGGLPELVAGLEAVLRGEQYVSPSLSGS